MRTVFFTILLLLAGSYFGVAQVAYGNIAPDIRYPVCGQRHCSRLSNDDVLYTILYFGYNDTPSNGQTPLEANPEFFLLTFSDALKPYFQNYNPDYGRALMIISTMKNQNRIERKLNITTYPTILLVDPNRRIIARSTKAGPIIEYITNNLSMFTSTDWNEYILRAKALFESGQKHAAQRIVMDCIRHGRWYDEFTIEAHKAIPLIAASMRKDEWYMDCVGEIKYRYNIGILSEEDVRPFQNEFKRIHMTGDKDIVTSSDDPQVE